MVNVIHLPFNIVRYTAGANNQAVDLIKSTALSYICHSLGILPSSNHPNSQCALHALVFRALYKSKVCYKICEKALLEWSNYRQYVQVYKAYANIHLIPKHSCIAETLFFVGRLPCLWLSDTKLRVISILYREKA